MFSLANIRFCKKILCFKEKKSDFRFPNNRRIIKPAEGFERFGIKLFDCAAFQAAAITDSAL